MSDTQGYTPSSGEGNAPPPENAKAQSTPMGTEAAALKPSEPPVAPEVPKTGNAWLSYGLCVLGAIVAVVLGTAVFSPDQSLISKWVVPLISATGTELVIAWQALTHALTVLPWALVFEVIAGFAVFYVCRMGKTRKVQNGFHISAVAGLGALAVYLLADSPDTENLLAAAKGLTVCALLLGFAFVTAEVRRVRFQSGECAACGYAGIGIVVTLASFVVWVSWAAYSQDTYPDVTTILQQKYGTQLEAMGFEDVNRNSLSNSGFCSSVDYHFHSGSSLWQTAPSPQGVFYNRDDYSDITTCMSMRFREGHLTAIYPNAYTHNSTTSDELRADAIKSADNLFVGIQTAYKNVQMENARKAQGF